MGIIHWDLKPNNICIGCKELSKIIYIIDLGLCKHYIDKNNNHI
jgi:tRNA A-37 threonylcarbamoyl transferase component Bud32